VERRTDTKPGFSLIPWAAREKDRRVEKL